MKALKHSDLLKMKKSDLDKKLTDLRREMQNLMSSAGRGTLKKESGSLKSVKRNIARLLTIMNEIRMKEDSK